MRSDLVFGALSHVSNRYQLCQLASKATRMLHKPSTRLQDTTNEPIANGRWQRDWSNWQRSADYYDEARLIWLEADMLIREASKGQRSLDDFAAAVLEDLGRRGVDRCDVVGMSMGGYVAFALWRAAPARVRSRPPSPRSNSRRSALDCAWSSRTQNGPWRAPSAIRRRARSSAPWRPPPIGARAGAASPAPP